MYQDEVQNGVHRSVSRRAVPPLSARRFTKDATGLRGEPLARDFDIARRTPDLVVGTGTAPQPRRHVRIGYPRSAGAR